MKEDLLRFIRDELAKQRSEQEIISLLQQNGWTNQDIHEAFVFHRKTVATQNDTKGIKKLLLVEIPLWLTITIILVLALIFAGTFAVLRYQKVYSYNLIAPGVNKLERALDYGAEPSLSNPDYFNSVRSQFIAQKVHFVEANLDTMQVTVYQDGSPLFMVPILAKGREGAWWETPAGLYKIETKEKNHFSSLGKVYQPWSMRFQGNFYIHGWPYYPDGTPVSSQFSGGCVRLSNEDAEKVFNAISVGTPILVYEKYFEKDSFTYGEQKPRVTADQYLAVDLKNNFVFVEQGAKEKVPVASITKLITALVTTEYLNLDSKVTVGAGSIIYTSKPRLSAGMKVNVFELMKLALLESSNEASEALASFYGRGAFISHMNKKAGALGMTDSTFVDPYGGGDGNISTAEDLFHLAKYLYNNRSFLLGLTSGKVKNTAYNDLVFSSVQNLNQFTDRVDFIGGKVGKTTAAKETMLAIFDIEMRGEHRPVAIIVLGSDNNKADVEVILEFIKSRFR